MAKATRDPLTRYCDRLQQQLAKRAGDNEKCADALGAQVGAHVIAATDGHRALLLKGAPRPGTKDYTKTWAPLSETWFAVTQDLVAALRRVRVFAKETAHETVVLSLVPESRETARLTLTTTPASGPGFDQATATEWLPVTGAFVGPRACALNAAFALDGASMPGGRWFLWRDPARAVTVASADDAARYLLMPVTLPAWVVLPETPADLPDVPTQPPPAAAPAVAPTVTAPVGPSVWATARMGTGGWNTPTVCWISRGPASTAVLDALAQRDPGRPAWVTAQRETPTYVAFDAARMAPADADLFARALAQIADPKLSKTLSARWAKCCRALAALAA